MTKKELEEKLTQLEDWLYEALEYIEEDYKDVGEDFEHCWEGPVLSWYREQQKKDPDYLSKLKETALEKAREALTKEELEVLGITVENF